MADRFSTDVSGDAVPASNAGEFTVSEISAALKRTVEDAYGYVRVRGEVSGYRGPHSSGHCYFALKDEKARLDAVVWRGVFSRLRFKPEEGLEVIATGKLTTYPGRSNYQIVIDAIEPAGAGALMALLEERRRKLTAEGLFDEAAKKPLPYLPGVIGVITSPTGAVIRDILHRLEDRFPRHVLVWPVRVQGETSAREVAAAVSGFNALAAGGAVPRPDLLIVARGGGSIEELWGFNEEIVVRAIAASGIPVISAVGHETDWTLTDLVADYRAPTPTAAAERAVPVRSDLMALVDELKRRNARALARMFEERRSALRSARRALPRPGDILALPRQRFDMASSGLAQGLRGNIHRHSLRLMQAGSKLSPRALARNIAQDQQQLEGLQRRALRGMTARLAQNREMLQRARGRLSPATLVRQIGQDRLKLEDFGRRARRCYSAHMDERRQQLHALEKMLSSLSYTEVLRRGFALVRGDDGQVIRSAGAVSPGAALNIEFADGKVEATARGAPAASGSRRPSRPKGGQGDLF